MLHLNEYQTFARDTAIYKHWLYPYLELCGEAGEVAEKVKKILRDKDGKINTNDREKIAYELGDVLWALSNAAYDIGYSLQEIAEMNLEKLADRKRRNVIRGDGDVR